jgi:hypothetical protein
VHTSFRRFSGFPSSLGLQHAPRHAASESELAHILVRVPCLAQVCCGLLGCRGGEVRHAGDEVELTRSDSKEEAGEASVEDESSATVAV